MYRLEGDSQARTWHIYQDHSKGVDYIGTIKDYGLATWLVTHLNKEEKKNETN